MWCRSSGVHKAHATDRSGRPLVAGGDTRSPGGGPACTLVVLSSVPASALRRRPRPPGPGLGAVGWTTGSTADQRAGSAPPRKKAEKRDLAAKKGRAAGPGAAWKKPHPKQKKASSGRAAPIEERRAAHGKAAKKAAPSKKAAAKRRAAKRWAARLARVKPDDPRTWIRYAPDHYTPPSGPEVQQPVRGRARRRALLTHVIRCDRELSGLPRTAWTRRPTGAVRLSPSPADYPSEIRIAVYSVVDQEFADAIVAAQRRCVSVKI